MKGSTLHRPKLILTLKMVTSLITLDSNTPVIISKMSKTDDVVYEFFENATIKHL